MRPRYLYAKKFYNKNLRILISTTQLIKIEHYVPFMENFPVDPKDAKFFGKPIDYVAFVDANSKKKCSIHFIEVKSGQSNLNSRQSNIKDAILEGRIHWHEFNVNGIWEHETKAQHLGN